MAARGEHNVGHLCHDSGSPAFLLHLRDPVREQLRDELADPRLERAIGVVYRPDTELQSHYKLAVQMPGHQWAAAQMWRGLIGPSDERWIAGARALATVRLTSVAQSVTPASELDVDDLARIRLYANRALTAKPQEARAELFGTLLTTCTHCHAVLRDR